MDRGPVARRLHALLPALRCPLCDAAFTLRGVESLICEAGHCFDLSSKGYVNLSPAYDQRAQRYDAALFESRRRVFDAGFYAHVLDAVRLALDARGLPPDALICDVGCGEGYYLRGLLRSHPTARLLGLDLSRDAILRAARDGAGASWLVADLKRLPLRDACADALLDVLTPADYAEFSRVLKPGGLLIKVVPNERYLAQMRSQLPLRNDGYSNARVLDRLALFARVLSQTTAEKTFPLSPEQAADFRRMSPMTFGVDAEALTRVSLAEITVSLDVLACEIR